MANPRPKQADPYGLSESAQDPELPCARKPSGAIAGQLFRGVAGRSARGATTAAATTADAVLRPAPLALQFRNENLGGWSDDHMQYPVVDDGPQPFPRRRD
jgi:hypothetical protein